MDNNPLSYTRSERIGILVGFLNIAADILGGWLFGSYTAANAMSSMAMREPSDRMRQWKQQAICENQTIAMPALGPLTQSYSYDSLNRLTGASEAVAGGGWSQSYGYYGNGNMLVSDNANLPPLTAETATAPSWYSASSVPTGSIAGATIITGTYWKWYRCSGRSATMRRTGR